jgi:recombination protein RecT
MTWAEVMKIKDRSRASKKGPWVTDEEEMAKKTVARRACKWIPMSSELAKALELEDQAEGSDQHGGVGLTVVSEEKPKSQTDKVKAALKAKSQVIDVQPGETDEQAEARHNEPPLPEPPDSFQSTVFGPGAEG